MSCCFPHKDEPPTSSKNTSIGNNSKNNTITKSPDKKRFNAKGFVEVRKSKTDLFNEAEVYPKKEKAPKENQFEKKNFWLYYDNN